MFPLGASLYDYNTESGFLSIKEYTINTLVQQETRKPGLW